MKTAPAAPTSGVTDPHLKDVYTAWLRDLSEDNSAKVVKTLSKKKRGGKKQLSHVLQSTEASASKHISMRKVGRRSFLYETTVECLLGVCVYEQECKLPTLPPPSANANAIQDAQLRRHQVLANEANCSSYQYQAPFQPGLAFFRVLVSSALASKCQAKGAKSDASKYEISSFPVRLPPTVLRANGETRFRLALLFTLESDAGASAGMEVSGDSFVLHVQTYSTEKQFREQRKALIRLLVNTEDETKAVCKYADDADCKRNATFLLKSSEEVEAAVDTLWNDEQQDDGGRAVQRYIPYKGASHPRANSSGNRKAWIARPVYRKKDKVSWIWILTDCSNSDITDTSHEGCQIVKCSGTQSWSEPRLLVSTCSQTLENLLQISLTELALDLLQDSEGKWWLLQVKAFQMRRHRPSSASCTAGASGVDKDHRVKSAPKRLESFNSAPAAGTAHKKWRCAGRYCSSIAGNNEALPASYPQSHNEPSGYLTKKVLLSCDFYDMYMSQQDRSLTSGFANFATALTFHLQHQTSKRDRTQLYEPQPLCSPCVGKYHFLREQWIETTTSAADSGAKHAGKSMKARKRSATSASHPPRLLPSLQGSSTPLLPAGSSLSSATALKASSSTPSVSSQSEVGASSHRYRRLRAGGVQHDSTCTNQQDAEERHGERPSYLSEMDRIEEMLAQHDDKFVHAKPQDQREHQSEPAMVSNEAEDDDASVSSRYFSTFLQQRNESNSIEDMWKSVSLKPVAPSTSDRPKPQYSSYSVSSGLQQLGESKTKEDGGGIASEHASTMPECAPLLQNRRDHDSTLVHTIAIHNCRQVFYDESFRESIVREAKEKLLEQHHSVRFVIEPSSIPQQSQESSLIQPQSTATDSDDDALAEMVLRTLFLDLGLSIGNPVPDALAPALKRMPTISRGASGCVTMTISG